MEKPPGFIEQSKTFRETNFTYSPWEALLTEKGDGEWARLGLDIRGALRKSIPEEGWFPAHISAENQEEFLQSMDGVEALFVNAEALVTERWKTHVSQAGEAVGPFEKARQEWVSALQDQEVSESLSLQIQNPGLLEKKLQIKQMDSLQELRGRLPHAWLGLLFASSERQHAELVVVRHWLQEISDEQIRSWGYENRDEIDLMIDVASLVGKHVDQAYIKQVYMSSLPGATNETPLPATLSKLLEEGKLESASGSEFVYDYQDDSGDVRLVPYEELFPREVRRISHHLNSLAQSVEAKVAAGSLSETRYRDLPRYLRSLAHHYDYKPTAVEEVTDRFLNELYGQQLDLYHQGCPLVLFPQSVPDVTGDANKVDMELRVGFITPEAKAKAIEATLLTRATKGVMELVDSETELETPELVPVFQAMAYGMDLYWETRGEDEPGWATVSTNAIENVAVTMEMPLLKGLFGIQVAEESYRDAAFGENMSHELGHKVLSPEDLETVAEKIDYESMEGKIMDEIKAETVGTLILEQAGNSNSELLLAAKLGTLADYMANKSDPTAGGGEKYSVPAALILNKLFQTGILSFDEGAGQYRVSNSAESLNVIRGLGRDILAVYRSEDTNASLVKTIVAEARALLDKPEIALFTQRAKQVLLK